MATRSRKLAVAPRAVPAPARPKIDLALQGGGSHGAFTWGVLDRLIEDGTLDFDGLSGTSAGALNAAVMATGWAAGGRDGARRALDAFWLDVSGSHECFGQGGGTADEAPADPFTAAAGAFASAFSNPLVAAFSAPFAAWAPPGLAAFNLDRNPFHAWQQQFLRLFSPYQFNPLGLNPLRDVVRRHVQEAALREGPLSLFITATAVRTGRPRVFTRADLSIDALLASACLPQLFRAVHIDGEPYWDGGYSGNPALWPLIYQTEPLDILLVKINPLQRPDLPDTPMEIADRVNEITFNAGLVSEMRAIAFVARLVAEGRVDAGRYRQLRLHMVADEDHLAALNPSSKMNTERRFLLALRDFGRDAASRWLAAHRADVGVRPSLDIDQAFLAPGETARR